jgi:hypothetical protein
VNEDIAGAAPRMLHFPLDKPRYNLTNDDIEGSKPDIVKFKSTRPPCNPLNPKYKLQVVEFVPPEVPKFIRDHMEIDDIQGVRSKPQPEATGRDPLKVIDIPGAKYMGPYVRKEAHDSHSYKDVTSKHWETKRCTNPLDP